jgi:hypothetical protein
MKRLSLKTTLLSPLTRALTILSLLSPLLGFAALNYPMIVVKEASVMKGPAYQQPAGVFQCQTTSLVSKSVKVMAWYSTPVPTAEKMLALERNLSVFATRRVGDDIHNIVTLWLATKQGGQDAYYQLTDVEMQHYELPKLTVIRPGVLLVEADTLSPDPNEDNLNMQIPIIPGQLRQTIFVGGLRPDGMQLSHQTCTR